MAGPMGFGKLSASLTTFNNENTAALMSNNFDFTLVKLEAPAEFRGVGSVISRNRKIDAEEGSLHRTARRLGALFDEMLPSTEDLFRAYGKRASEISDMLSINPREESFKEGIFAGYIGTDTTSIWAAVTSGSAAIAVHLLGCMLARVFTGPEAISIWVEIVQRQKEWIHSKEEGRLYANDQPAAIFAAHQEISRADLAKWDASARAWLQSADQAMELHHKQTMLILKSVNVPVNNVPDTYKSVMKAWIVALEAMNSLVKGLPQRVQDGAALLAISSWHLYPDIFVGDCCVEVKQKDPIFDRAALLTMGLQHVRQDVKSVYWSLPLAHLQYYGHPIQTSRSTSEDNSRIGHHQFAYVVVGCVFSGWKGYATTNEEGLNWLRKLALILSLSTQNRFDHAHKPTWLIYLIAAAQDYEECDESEKIVAKQLMNLGRRFSTFLHPNQMIPPPLFGLSQIHVLISILKNDHERVHCLRKLCAYLKLDGSEFYIKYQASVKEGWFEYATVVPARQIHTKRMSDGSFKEPELRSEKHVRWISLTDHQLLLFLRRGEDFKDIDQAAKKLAELEEKERLDKAATGRYFNGPDRALIEITIEREERKAYIRDLYEIIAIGRRKLEIEQKGELFLPVIEYFQDPGHRYYEDSSNRQFRTTLMFSTLMFTKSLDFLQATRDLLREKDDPHAKRSAIPHFLFAGDISKAALYSSLKMKIREGWEFIPGPDFVGEFFTQNKLRPENIYRHFSFSYSHQFVQSELSCLRACAMMAEIYHLLPGATISTLVVNMSLRHAKWIPMTSPNDPNQQIKSMTLSQTFACIAMFESGTCNLDPQQLIEAFAMASGNSLYIAGALLCDPYEQPNATEISRVVGNVGRPGITFLISPPEVKTRKADPQKWRTINHREFNGLPENHFDRTSVHLSFTNYEIPLITENTSQHMIDHTVILLETLVSIYDRGVWVSEIDILKGLNSEVRRVVKDATKCPRCKISNESCTYQGMLARSPQLAATSVENWDEFIDAPCTGAVAIRAHQNWLARLAATAVCAKLNFAPLILPSEVCWFCCAELAEIPPEKKGGRIAFIF